EKGRKLHFGRNSVVFRNGITRSPTVRSIATPRHEIQRILCNGALPRYTASKQRILGMGRKPQKNDSLPGSLDMLILKALDKCSLPGYATVQFSQQSAANESLVEEGSLFPALQRLELNGWIDGEWGITPNNRRGRIYRITTRGRNQLREETKRYKQLTLAIARV